MALSVAQNEIPRRIVLIRHGETPWSLSGQHTGKTDVPLDEQGRQAALGLRERLCGEHFTQMYSSPLSRACETARLAGFEHPVLLEDLMEWDYGDYEGRTTPQIWQERPDWILWDDGCPGGESAADVGMRADRVIEMIVAASNPEDVVAVFGHGHMLRTLGARWLDLSPEHGRRFILDTAAVCELVYEHATRVISRWNT